MLPEHGDRALQHGADVVCDPSEADGGLHVVEVWM